MANLTSLLLVCVVQILSTVLARSPHILFIVADDYGKIFQKKERNFELTIRLIVLLFFIFFPASGVLEFIL